MSILKIASESSQPIVEANLNLSKAKLVAKIAESAGIGLEIRNAKGEMESLHI